MKKYVIGLDIGTSSIKGILARVDEREEFVTGRCGFDYVTDDRGTVEISAGSYMNSCMTLLKKLSSALPDDGELLAVSTATASGNILFLDENYNPISTIVNWQDKRTNDEPDTILGADFDKEAYFKSTGWAFDGKTFPLATLSRLKVNNPELFSKNNKLCMSTEYMYYCLTGEWGLSTSAGTPFYLIDQQTGKYRTDILEKFGLKAEQLPPVLPVGTIVGKVTEDGNKLSGLPVGTPLIAGTFDHPSAARGVGVLKEGQMLLSCGTSWVGFYPIDDREKAVKNKLLIDPFLSENNGPWAGMVSLASVAAKIEDYIRMYVCNEGNVYKTFEKYSSESEIGAGGLKLTLSDADNAEEIKKYPKRHIARAIMECVVGMLQKDFERLEAGGVKATSAVMVGGPSECPLWTKIIEQITGMTVVIRHGSFAGSVGSASVAGIAAGVFENEAQSAEFFNS